MSCPVKKFIAKAIIVPLSTKLSEGLKKLHFIYSFIKAPESFHVV